MAKITLQIIPYGGIYGATVTSIVAEMIATIKRGHEFKVMDMDRDLSDNIAEPHKIKFVRTDGDSLLPRRRSVALTEFYASGDDCIVTIDHDVSWRPGDALKIAERALELDSIVGGLYSKRAEGCGWGSRLAPGAGKVEIPSDRVISAQYVGSGFMAIPRYAVKKMLDDPKKCGLSLCWNGQCDFWDFYQTINIPHPKRVDRMEMLSEDWAFCHRAMLAGVECYIDLRPYITHYGERGFTPAHGATVKADKEETVQHAS